MNYAKEVIDLLAANPGRQFRMQDLARYVDPRATGVDRQRIRNWVLRVLTHLELVGSTEKIGGDVRGSFALHCWAHKVPHELLGKRHEEGHNFSGMLRPDETQQ